MKIPEVYLVEVDHCPGALAKVLQVVGDQGIMLSNLAAVRRNPNKTTWEMTAEVDEHQVAELWKAIDDLHVAKVVGRSDRVFTRHEGGKIESISRINLSSVQVLRDVYTPGVARVCLAIQEDPALARKYTTIPRTVAIVTNGTAILGLGDIGPVAGMPVMEGKAALFHSLAGLSGVPILIDSHDPQQIVETVVAIAPSFGAIQLEDIAAPDCFEIERALIDRLDRPVLHDDQHGTAVVALAATLTATRRTGRRLEDSTVGQIGLGAAGLGIARVLSAYGVSHQLGTDLSEEARMRFGVIGGEPVDIETLMARSDIVIATTGVRGLIRKEWVRPGQMILALSNPDPEIEPEEARAAGAAFAADGKNVNNVLGFPGLFRGVLEANARRFTPEMLVAAAETISALAPENELVPDALDRAVHDAVAETVRELALGRAPVGTATD